MRPFLIFLLVILSLPSGSLYADSLECLKGLSGADLARRSQLKPGVSWTWLLEEEPLHQGVAQAEAGRSPVVYDLDLFWASPKEIDSLKKKNKVVICYVAGGSMEFAGDATRSSNGAVIPCAKRKRLMARPELNSLLSDIPSAAIGGMIADWPVDCWLDPRHPAVFKALDKIASEAKNRGCDGVEFDNMDGGLDDENRSQAGFSKNKQAMVKAQLDFNARVADMLHRHGLCAAIKNGHSYADQQCDKFDLAVVEGVVAEGGEALNGWKKCAVTKPVLAAEYPGPKNFSSYSCPTRAGNLSVNYFKDREFVNGGTSCTTARTSGEQSSGEAVK